VSVVCRALVAVVATVAATATVSGCSSAPPAAGSPPPVTASSTAGAAEPAEVRIPKIDAVSSLVPLGLEPDRSVEVPPVETPMQAGWFTGAPKPGEPGPAVLLGHVNGGGQAGIFARLAELGPGDEVLVGRADGSTVRFLVRHVDQVSKTAFPTDEVYGNTAGPELRLITCGGSFDERAGSYRDNIIVYATTR
jgi:sortase (surface protein transpeptidase)